MGKMTMSSGSPASTGSPSEYDIKSNKYESVIDNNANIKPFTSKTKSNQNVVYVGWFKDPIPGLSDIVKREWKCTECANRSMNLSRIIGGDSRHFCAPTYVDETDIRNDIQIAANKVARKAWNDSPSNWSLLILPHPDLYPYRNDDEFDVRDLYVKSKGSKGNGGSFNHYYINVSNDAWLAAAPLVSDAEIDNALLQKALDKYTPLLRQFIKRTIPTERDYEALRKSFKVFKKIIDTVPYAKVLNHGISFMNHLLSLSDNCDVKQPCYLTEAQLMYVIGNTIISSKISPGENGDAIITAFHQLSKNALDLITSAVCEKAMINMCRARFAPDKYEQPTAAPSAKKVANTLKKFGDYSVSICTHDELTKHIPSTVTIMGDTCSASSGGAAEVMKKMLAKSKLTSKFDFAGRHINSSGFYIDSIKTLVELIESGYVTSLDIKCADHCVDANHPTSIETAYFGNFHNFNPEHLITKSDWGWSFLLAPEKPRFNGHHKVTHIVPFSIGGWKTYVFILHHARTCPTITDSISWAGILDEGVRRTHGSTFSTVGENMPVKYPEGDLAIGVGVSEPGTSSALNRTITVYINGDYSKPIKISMGGMH